MNQIQPLDIRLIRERVFSMLSNSTLSKVQFCNKNFFHHVKGYCELRQATSIRFRVELLVKNRSIYQPFEILFELKCVDTLFLKDGTPLLVFEPTANLVNECILQQGQEEDGCIQFKITSIEYASNRGMSGVIDYINGELSDLFLAGLHVKESWLYGEGFKIELECLSIHRSHTVRFNILRAFLDCSFIYAKSNDMPNFSTNASISPLEAVSKHLSVALNCEEELFPNLPTNGSRINSRSLRFASNSCIRYRYTPITGADQNSFIAMCWDYMLAFATDSPDIHRLATDLAKSMLAHHSIALRKVDASVAKTFTTQRKAEELLANMNLTHSKRVATEARMKIRVVREFLIHPLARAYLRCSGYEGNIDSAPVYAHLAGVYAAANLENPRSGRSDMPIISMSKFQDWIVNGLRFN